MPEMDAAGSPVSQFGGDLTLKIFQKERKEGLDLGVLWNRTEYDMSRIPRTLDTVIPCSGLLL
jgi:hypothetical protein